MTEARYVVKETPIISVQRLWRGRRWKLQPQFFLRWSHFWLARLL